MVFSQTSLDTQSILKVVELNRLKAEKNQQVNGLTGVVTGGISRTTAPSPMPATSFTEVLLKSEPLYESTMFDTDYEFFQDLQCSFAPAKDEQVQTIDSLKKTEERALQLDTTHTPFSPQGWETFDANSSHNPAGFYTTTPIEALSPMGQCETNFLNLSDMETGNNVQFQEQFVNLNSLPVVIGDLASEKVTETMPWPGPDLFEWTNTQTDYSQSYTNTRATQPLMDAEEDSLDLKQAYVIPRDIENTNVVISEYEYIQDVGGNGGILQEAPIQRRGERLSVDVSARVPFWPSSTISTPEVLTYVEQLEKEKCTRYVEPQQKWPEQNLAASPLEEASITTIITPPTVDYEPITPKSESHVDSEEDTKPSPRRKRRHDSEDSDESYTPYSETPNRKTGRKRKPSVPIKDMILALEGSQTQSPVRRGRPPKRRVSTVSSVCSVDENCSSNSTQEYKYRELRDKNNEASKRSRMNRKLKELQMEQLADELEEKNKNLRIRADILENMTKRLKNELMTAILKK